MSNVTQLRRKLNVGDKVKIDELVVYTVSRIDGTRLYGYLVGDKYAIRPKERWICRDYKTPVRRVVNGQEIVFRVTHLDGRHIQ